MTDDTIKEAILDIEIWLATLSEKDRKTIPKHAIDIVQEAAENQLAQKKFLLIKDQEGLSDWVFHGILDDESIARVTQSVEGYQIIRGRRIRFVDRSEDIDSDLYSEE